MGNWNSLREPRIGICLHYDDSGSDAGAAEWLTKDPRCKVSYNILVLDQGQVIDVAPMDKRAWHAGICRPSDPRLVYTDANSALWGIAIAARAGETATPAQKEIVAALCRKLFRQQGWRPDLELWRIVGHNTEAWPRGRKIDPEGPDPTRPVLSVLEIRGLVGSGEPVLRAERRSGPQRVTP